MELWNLPSVLSPWSKVKECTQVLELQSDMKTYVNVNDDDNDNGTDDKENKKEEDENRKKLRKWYNFFLLNL